MCVCVCLNKCQLSTFYLKIYEKNINYWKWQKILFFSKALSMWSKISNYKQKYKHLSNIIILNYKNTYRILTEWKK